MMPTKPTHNSRDQKQREAYAKAPKLKDQPKPAPAKKGDE